MTPSFHQGTVVEDRYELVSCLGEGGTGSVWLAKDLERRITVAVKVLRPELSKRKEMLQQFQREAELSARMMSPNIVKVFARGVDAHGTPYIVYELLDGEDLATRLTNLHKLDLVETETVVVHVARALSRAHAVGVVHRDIKPANIFLTKDQDGRLLAKVVDFGVAEIIAKTCASDELSGTLEYMAPELILEGKAPEARSDLYSIAIVAYHCLVGCVPFVGETLGKVMVAVATTQVTPVSERLGGSLPELDAWFVRALAKDPALRFGSARELAEAFHAAAKASKKHMPELAGAAPESAKKSDEDRGVSSEVVRLDRTFEALQPVSLIPEHAGVRRRLPANMPPLPMNPPRPTPSTQIAAHAKGPPPIPREAPSRKPNAPQANAPKGPPPLPNPAAATLPPMRPRAQSFVFDEELDGDLLKKDARRE